MFNTELQQLLSKIDENSFLISDTHFFHEEVTKFEPSRLEAMRSQRFAIESDDVDYIIKEHNEWIIFNWNNTIQENDLVIHLGDFAWKGIQEIIPRLNGIKILILGNHDRKGDQVYKGFDHVVRGSYLLKDEKLYIASSNDALLSSLQLIIRDKRLLLSHYPAHADEHRYRKDNDTNEISWEVPINKRIDEMIKICEDEDIDLNIHGHTHSKCYTGGYCWEYSNVSLENINFKPKRLGEILDNIFGKNNRG